MADEIEPKSYEEYRKLICERRAAQKALEPKTAAEMELDRRASNQTVAEGFAEDLGWQTSINEQGDAVVQDMKPKQTPSK